MGVAEGVGLIDLKRRLKVISKPVTIWHVECGAAGYGFVLDGGCAVFVNGRGDPHVMSFPP